MNFTEQQIERAACAAHEANRILCEALGDKSQLVWADAPEWQKASAMLGVRKVVSGEVCQPGQSHKSWYDHKLSEGWKYGPVKDVEKKEHPCMVHFDDLPNDQRMKDVMFLHVVQVSLGLSVWEIFRINDAV